MTAGAGMVRVAAPTARLSGFALAHQLFTQRRYREAERTCEQALEERPDHADGWFLRAAAALEQGAHDRALAAMQGLAARAPQRAEVRFNIGHIHERRGDHGAAVEAYRAATDLAPDYAQAWNNLGNALRATHQTAAAISAYRELVRLTPQAASAWNNLGVALKSAGAADEAAACYQRALACDASYAPAHGNLGRLQAALHDHAAAEASLREALRLDPGLVDSHLGLAGVLRQTGRFAEALASCRQALRLRPDHPPCWIALVDGLQGMRCAGDDPQLRAELVGALAQPAVDPLNLVPVAASLLKHTPGLVPLFAATGTDQSWPLARFDAWFRDPLLGALLDCAVIADWDIETALCRVRRALLEAAGGGTRLAPRVLEFGVALALQCLLTEYVYPESTAETALVERLARQLETSLAAGRADAAQLAVYACYRPLAGLPGYAQFQPASAALARLRAAHLEAPREEARLRATLTRLGDASDGVSRAVQAQYEEHPYPRWERVGTREALPLAQLARTLLPQAVLSPHGEAGTEAPRVLVAGCGTGRHPIQTATRIAGARVLGVDLSAASLGYAMRKAQALRVDNIEFLQADILDLGALDGGFDLIESFGVLHHMRDPLAGWRVLTGLLAPGGLMVIGLYSERARAPVVACRELVGRRGYANTAAAIRQFRQDLVRQGPPQVVAAILNSPDFYSVSDCRDLIFHVQEHRYTLPRIGAMGEGLGLRCLGMELDDPALYAGLPGEDGAAPALDDLAGWDRFETAHPAAFGSTYKIWWQKP